MFIFIYDEQLIALGKAGVFSKWTRVNVGQVLDRYKTKK